MSDYLPAGAVGGRIELEMPEGAEFASLATQLGIPENERFVVSINDTLVPDPEQHRLEDGDKVIIMAPLAAG